MIMSAPFSCRAGQRGGERDKNADGERRTSRHPLTLPVPWQWLQATLVPTAGGPAPTTVCAVPLRLRLRLGRRTCFALLIALSRGAPFTTTSGDAPRDTPPLWAIVCFLSERHSDRHGRGSADGSSGKHREKRRRSKHSKHSSSRKSKRSRRSKAEGGDDDDEEEDDSDTPPPPPDADEKEEGETVPS